MGLVLCSLLLGLGPSFQDPAAESQKVQPLSERERAVHLLSRLAFGGRPGDLERVLEMGVEAWIDQQLQPQDLKDSWCDGLISELPSVSMNQVEINNEYGQRVPAGASLEERRKIQRRRNTPRYELMQSVLVRALTSERQLQEVMSEFWRNHFNVSFTKGAGISLMINTYEKDVIRGHVFGQFHSMLEASAKHPAMLFFLDNALSRRPATKTELKAIGRRTRRETGSEVRADQAVQLAKQRGLNENYARELLELHTLGVDNFYKQKDVVAVAEALTGWTIREAKRGDDPGFRFENAMHVPGNKRVLGKVIRTERDNGVIEGEQILTLLARHRGTAEFISEKLLRYLVADEPPKALLKATSKEFQKTKGDLQAVISFILKSDEFWQREHFQAKFKTPFEFVTSSLRVTGAEFENTGSILRVLIEMGQPVYMCDPPTGYYDTAEAWLDPGVLATRWEFALNLAAGKLEGIRIPDSFYEDVPVEPARLWQHHLSQKIIPAGVGKRTQDALTRTTNAYLRRNKTPDIRQLGPQLVGLLLGSPEFQRQ
ncbi:MAG: DUF1800 domain-containing protein [Planctomycetota bacterium]|nr:MAG: DUF1800 domain-containing protein [Planctomycetota bacterium]